MKVEQPHVNVLSKVDLIEKYAKLPFNLDFFTEVLDLSYLLQQFSVRTVHFLLLFFFPIQLFFVNSLSGSRYFLFVSFSWRHCKYLLDTDMCYKLLSMPINVQ